MNILFSNLAIWYPAINKLLFKAIFKNTLTFINILKLSTNYTPDYKEIKILKISNTLTVNTFKEDAWLSNVKGSSHCFQYFLLYNNILLHFTPARKRYHLTISFYAYINCFLGFTIFYTSESMKFFYIMFVIA